MSIDPILKSALEKAFSEELLTQELYQKFLAAAENGLTPEQLQQALEALKQAEEKYAAAKVAYDAKVKTINEKHFQDLKRVVPKVMGRLEEKDRTTEGASAEKLLNTL